MKTQAMRNKIIIQAKKKRNKSSFFISREMMKNTNFTEKMRFIRAKLRELLVFATK